MEHRLGQGCFYTEELLREYKDFEILGNTLDLRNNMNAKVYLDKRVMGSAL